MENKSYVPFLIVWTGQLFSGIGTGMTGFVLGVHVFEQTNSTVSFAMVMLALFVPAILFGPLGGILADRYDRRVMIILGDAGSAVAVTFLLLCLLIGHLPLWSIYMGVAFGSAFTALQGPAFKASLSDLLSPSQFAKAGGLIQLAYSTRYLIAPIAGGFLLSIYGIKGVFLTDITSFGIAVAAVLCLPKKKRKKQQIEKIQFLTEMKEGWKSLSKYPSIKQIVIKLALVTFFAGCVQTLFTPMMLAITDVKTLGTIQSISALGMLAGSLLITILGLKRNLQFQMRLGLGSGGLFLAAMAMSTNLLLITIFFFLFFLCLPLINTSAEVQIRTEIPNQKQGRIWGISSLLSQTGYIAAYLSAGFLSDKVISPLIQQGVFAEPGRRNALILMICGLGLILTAFTGEKRCCYSELSEKI